MSGWSALFVCVHNSARSQMGEAFLRLYGTDLFERVESAGIQAGTLNPLVVKAMAEKQIDISKQQTKKARDFLGKGTHFDYVISMYDEAKSEPCPIFPGLNRRVRWIFSDPMEFGGDEESKLQAIREIRDGIEEAVKKLVETERSRKLRA